MDIITNTEELSCNQGTTKSKLTVTSQDFVTIEDKPIATEGDKQANVNIMPFGQCKLKPTTGGYLPCVPVPTKWEQTAEKDTINDLKILTEKSTCQCAVGGKISVTHKGHNEQHEIE